MAAERRFALVAGEASGDLLGADLVEGLRRRLPGAEFAGIGGPRMAAAGMDCWWSADELSLMGLAEVLSHLPRLLRLRRRLFRRLLAWKPDAFIGIDAPDFNLGLEKRLKRRSLTTVHYVSPSIWAWRAGRARRIGRSADRVLALFPFEPATYAEHGVDARFVGHPLAERFPDKPDRTAMRRKLGLEPDGQLLAVLPGSRGGELQRLGEPFAHCLAALHQADPSLRFVSPAARPATGARFREQLRIHAPDVSVTMIEGRSDEVLMASDAALLASGTAALEAMLARCPMVVAYRIAPLTHFLVHALGMMATDRFSLPNVLAGERLVPEILQDELTPERLRLEVSRLLEDQGAREHQLLQFDRLHESLRAPTGAAADGVLELLEPESP